MEDKLKELTEKIYQEGIEQANKEADEIINNAKQEAEQIKKDARAEKEKIIKEAQKEAENQKKSIETELKVASDQSINALKQQITDLITAEVIDKQTKEAFNDPEFIKQLIIKLVENWTSEDTSDLTVILPAKDKEKFENNLKADIQNALNQEIEIKYDDNLKTGFTISPQNGSYKILFNDETFNNFFKEFIRPKTRNLLYNEK
ncbi:MAG: V-type ATP synthase subunit E [Bacteroidales bacterium]